jgi:CHASE2 domain-containing sensor protein
VGAVCGLVAWVVTAQPFFDGLEEWLQDSCFAFRGERATETKVVIVGIDDATLAELPKPLAGFSPELAEVVSYLKARGASAIGLDLMISETLDAYDADHKLNGKALGLAAAKAGNVVVPMMVGDAGKAVFPLHTWRTGSPSALVEVSADVDHIIRRQQLAGTVGGESYDGLPLALLQTAGLADTDRAGRLYIDHHPVPLDSRGRLRINFVGPPGTVPCVAFKDMLHAAREARTTIPVDQRNRPTDVEGAVVIIGATAHSMGDYHATPYANGTIFAPWRSGPRLMSGPELLANVVATLGDGAFITTPPALTSLPWVLLFGGVLGWVFSRVTLAQGLVIGTVHHFGWKLIVLILFWVLPHF